MPGSGAHASGGGASEPVAAEASDRIMSSDAAVLTANDALASGLPIPHLPFVHSEHGVGAPEPSAESHGAYVHRAADESRCAFIDEAVETARLSQGETRSATMAKVRRQRGLATVLAVPKSMASSDAPVLAVEKSMASSDAPELTLTESRASSEIPAVNRALGPSRGVTSSVVMAGFMPDQASSRA